MLSTILAIQMWGWTPYSNAWPFDRKIVSCSSQTMGHVNVQHDVAVCCGILFFFLATQMHIIMNIYYISYRYFIKIWNGDLWTVFASYCTEMRSALNTFVYAYIFFFFFEGGKVLLCRHATSKMVKLIRTWEWMLFTALVFFCDELVFVLPYGCALVSNI